MRQFFRNIGILSFFMFSFIYLNNINNVLISKNSITLDIINYSNEYTIPSVDATVMGEYIIPGISGKTVAIVDSYYNMKKINTFNELFLIYNDVIPQISVENNLDKIILQGNSAIRQISLIIDDNFFVERYLIDNNIKASKLITFSEYDEKSRLEQINNDYKDFKKLSDYLDNSVCVVNSINLDICKKMKHYLVSGDGIVNDVNFLKIKNSLYSGQIILISNNLELDNFKLLYSEIVFKDYNLVYLSDIISE